jgi:hypothetical protein
VVVSCTLQRFFSGEAVYPVTLTCYLCGTSRTEQLQPALEVTFKLCFPFWVICTLSSAAGAAVAIRVVLVFPQQERLSGCMD